MKKRKIITMTPTIRRKTNTAISEYLASGGKPVRPADVFSSAEVLFLLANVGGFSLLSVIVEVVVLSVVVEVVLLVSRFVVFLATRKD